LTTLYLRWWRRRRLTALHGRLCRRLTALHWRLCRWLTALNRWRRWRLTTLHRRLSGRLTALRLAASPLRRLLLLLLLCRIRRRLLAPLGRWRSPRAVLLLSVHGRGAHGEPERSGHYRHSNMMHTDFPPRRRLPARRPPSGRARF
jgi:hypothetical protein